MRAMGFTPRSVWYGIIMNGQRRMRISCSRPFCPRHPWWRWRVPVWRSGFSRAFSRSSFGLMIRKALWNTGRSGTGRQTGFCPRRTGSMTGQRRPWRLLLRHAGINIRWAFWLTGSGKRFPCTITLRITGTRSIWCRLIPAIRRFGNIWGNGW